MTAAEEIAEFFVHTATVETYTGRNATGPVFDAPRAVVGFAVVKRSLVRGADGQQVISETTWACAAESYDLFKPGSRVTITGRPPATVITATLATSGALDLPDHCSVALT